MTSITKIFPNRKTVAQANASRIITTRIVSVAAIKWTKEQLSV